MAMMWRLVVVMTILMLGLTSLTYAKLECRQPNYVTRDGKIYAQDPLSPSTESEITIRGVAWSGMEKETMVPDGLWGASVPNTRGVQGTKMSSLIQFFTKNSINSVRLPLSAWNIIANALPQLGYIHSTDSRELRDPKGDQTIVTYFDLLGRLIQTLQNTRISVLLDIHSLADYPQDAYWYTAPYINITRTPTYQAVSAVAKTFCNSSYWNVLGVDIKNEMSGVQWNSDPADKNIKNDWQGAAEVLANRVLELCPQWLVFVGGASSPSGWQTFSAGSDYKKPSSHWDGGNLHNVTKSPMKVKVENKIVFAPHAHAHGKLPQNYFFSPDSNCSGTFPATLYNFTKTQMMSDCVDFINGAKVKSKYECTGAEFGCSKYKHVSVQEIATQYEKVMNEAIGDVVAEGKTPVILGSFSGVYGAVFHPHQTAALDFLTNYTATKLRGGYFWALNPDTEYFLEYSTNGGSGLFGKTHYGVFKANSWQQPNEDLLQALARLPSSDIPCFGSSLASQGRGQSAAVTPTMSAVLLLPLTLSLALLLCVQ